MVFMTQKVDRTVLAVKRQLKGMDANSYELGIKDTKTGKMMLRTWTAEKVEKSVPWLKRENARGSDIYIRPEGSQGLVLIDDIGRGTIDRMEADGIEPAAVIETSPMNYQAWVRVSQEPLEEKLATQIAKNLAQQYAGDPNSADWKHFGRLAGFTNRKPKHVQENGRYPYVLAHKCSGKMASMASKLLDKAREDLLMQNTLLKTKGSRLKANLKEAVLSSDASSDAVQFYQQQLDEIRKRYGTDLDRSRADWMIARKMAIAGYSSDAIKQALRASPGLQERKRGHEEDYINRTVEKVMCDPEVQKALYQQKNSSMDLELGE